LDLLQPRPNPKALFGVLWVSRNDNINPVLRNRPNPIPNVKQAKVLQLEIARVEQLLLCVANRTSDFYLNSAPTRQIFKMFSAKRTVANHAKMAFSGVMALRMGPVALFGFNCLQFNDLEPRKEEKLIGWFVTFKRGKCSSRRFRWGKRWVTIRHHRLGLVGVRLYLSFANVIIESRID
jgi:hypothetical protein